MIKLGFLLSHIGDKSEIAEKFIDSANEFLRGHVGVDIIGFVCNQHKPVRHPNFAIMNINEAFDFDGVAVATDLMTSQILLRLPGPRKKFFYVCELWWHNQSKFTFEELLNMYNNHNFPLIARTQEDKEIIEKCWNCKVRDVIKNFNMEFFVKHAK